MNKRVVFYTLVAILSCSCSYSKETSIVSKIPLDEITVELMTDVTQSQNGYLSSRDSAILISKLQELPIEKMAELYDKCSEKIDGTPYCLQIETNTIDSTLFTLNFKNQFYYPSIVMRCNNIDYNLGCQGLLQDWSNKSISYLEYDIKETPKSKQFDIKSVISDFYLTSLTIRKVEDIAAEKGKIIENEKLSFKKINDKMYEASLLQSIPPSSKDTFSRYILIAIFKSDVTKSGGNYRKVVWYF